MPAQEEALVDSVEQTVTDDELSAKRKEVEDLRKELADAETQRLNGEAAKANEVVNDQLESEASRLRAMIAQAKGIDVAEENPELDGSKPENRMGYVPPEVDLNDPDVEPVNLGGPSADSVAPTTTQTGFASPPLTVPNSGDSDNTGEGE